ncbi:hypothetical protein H6P81_007059 [Aristolochia fimbriata]|uniref:DUF4218 domain-containing protein n=1 Tax=Aristolochia fimbriata TaxID=158543 RepID=A0AAV7EZ34_ARIFI|nr:hypothetical protein H6P81_007059 [Aristolochia fimbriata]
MYPVERFLRKLKIFVQNKARPEGSITEVYIDNEALTYCSIYIDGVEMKFNRAYRNYDEDPLSLKNKIYVFLHTARELSGRNELVLTPSMYRKMLWVVVNNCDEIEEYLMFKMPSQGPCGTRRKTTKRISIPKVGCSSSTPTIDVELPLAPPEIQLASLDAPSTGSNSVSCSEGLFGHQVFIEGSEVPGFYDCIRGSEETFASQTAQNGVEALVVVLQLKKCYGR